MKAIIQEKYGSPNDLRLKEVEEPALQSDEIRVRVRATSVHPDVWHVIRGWPRVLRLMGGGLLRPNCPIPGTEAAGVVEALGSSVTRFKVGDEVFGETLRGMQWRNGGAYAEVAAMPEDGVALKPPNVSFEQAATVATAGIITLHNLRAVRPLGPGKRVLINGAAGSVGAIAVQIAKLDGAHVTGVERPEKLDQLRTLGADEVIDFTREDFTQRPDLYDLVFDIPGNHPFEAIERVLKPDGKYILIGHDDFGRQGRKWLGSIPRIFRLMTRARANKHLIRGDFSAPDKRMLMAELAEHLQAGRLTPVVGQVFPLSEAAAAIACLEAGALPGRIVLRP